MSYLAGRLQKVLQNKTIMLSSDIQVLFQPSEEYPGDFDDQPWVDCFLDDSSWTEYTSRKFRRRQTILIHYHTPTVSLPSASLHFFWKLPIAPAARLLWFRLIFRKVRCQLTVSSYDTLVSPFCLLCGEEREDLPHLFITCPLKLQVWQQAFQRFAPYVEFSASSLQQLVFDLQMFELVDNTALYVLASKVMHAIWRSHWRFFFDRVPFQSELVLSQVFKL